MISGPAFAGRESVCPDALMPFETAVRAVLGQQITVKAAGTLAARIVERYGPRSGRGFKGLTHIFLFLRDLLALGGDIAKHFGALGVTSARANTIYMLAMPSHKGKIDFGLCARSEKRNEEADDDPRHRRLDRTIYRHAHNGMAGRFPGDRFRGKEGASGPYRKELRVMAQAWRPWRSLCTMNLWNTLQEERDVL